ncbi:hypothetical protein Ppa06_57540 [Planomonospora parontospora subsp. parontospora]|uniref:Uncharacterized protein n=2 Tax=Planomonospora parontospora TaxID=58119 RepID=A0AA37BLK7_9ACTN|nr:hypothetical protein [Planomonospora parontospora]GGK90796.1 hypothetical protein GCM10010126_57770 [Planomonospora parontospora]GII11956.1 hypothetical protein Ppa06_57540 [Planomonospora parontospora subsp. parontospora]
MTAPLPISPDRLGDGTGMDTLLAALRALYDTDEVPVVRRTAVRRT